MDSQGMPKRRGRIGVTLIAAFVLLALVPLTVVGLVSLNRFEEQARNQVFNQLASVSEIKSSQIQRWINTNRVTINLVFADSVQYADMLALLEDPEDEATAEDLTVYFNDQLAAQDSFLELSMYDTNGEILISTDDSLVGRYVSIQSYFQPSLREPYIQPPFFDVEKFSMFVTHPIYDGDQNIVGVLAGRVDLDRLSEIMTERNALGETGETYLVSNFNKYIVTTSRLDSSSRFRIFESEGISLGLSGQEGSGTYDNYQDERVIGVYRWIPELGTALLSEVNESAALETIIQVREFSILAAGVVAVLAIALAVLITLWITRPIVALTEVAQEMLRGNYNQRADINRNNEIGQLGDAFNDMTNKLLEMIDGRNQRIREIAEANHQLEMAKRQAEEGTRLKSEFLATMSHELRTPLNATIGFSDMLLMGMSGELNEKQQHKVLRIQENGKRLLTLINNILDLTRIEAGRIEILHEPFSLPDLCQRISAQMDVLAHQAKLEFLTYVDPDMPPMVLGDEKRLEQVVVNLLSNAFKFTDTGEVRFEVMSKPEEGVYTIAVTDSGIGIPPHALDIIFDEFRQVDGSSTRSHKGSGLGLAITRNIVRMMDGKVTVQSKLGVGSTFTVTLPLNDTEEMQGTPVIEGMSNA